MLLATDFGRAAVLAQADAAMLSRAYGAPVDVVHVLAAAARTHAGAETRRALARKWLEECRARLLEAGARFGELRTAEGSAAEAVLHVAEALDSSLIVLGAGDRASRAFGTGATAETIARFARPPVWVSRPRREPGLARVCVALDGSPASREALRFATDLCDRLAATLSLVHALEHHEHEGNATTAELAEQQGAASRELTRFVETAGHPSLASSIRYEPGRASEVLARVAREEQADLLVVGRTGTGALRRVFLGGTAERLLRSAPAALLLTSPAGPA